MFSEKKFIDVSRKFVCVRVDSYESEEHVEWVRRFLDGSFANTAFCVLSPDGNDWLTRAGRGPHMAFRGDETEGMNEIAKRYPVEFDPLQAVVQDFHSVGQALNVASAEQRVLVLVAGPKEKIDPTRETLRPVINHDDFIGRFHVDFESGGAWEKRIVGAKASEGILFIASGEFGSRGKVLEELPLDATQAEIRAALLKSNATFAETTEKKVYSTHVDKGRLLGISYENTIPYGEDRDGDGEIDRRGGRRRSGGGRPPRGR